MIPKNVFPFGAAICSPNQPFSQCWFCSSRKSIWSFYLPSEFDFLFCVFSKTWKSIWSSYLLSKLMLFWHGIRNVANFAETLWNIRSGEAFLAPWDDMVQFRAPREPPQALCFIRFPWSSQPRGAPSRKGLIWTTNSCSILIFTFFEKRKIKNQIPKANRSSILNFQKEKNRSEKRAIWSANSCSKSKNQFRKSIWNGKSIWIGYFPSKMKIFCDFCKNKFHRFGITIWLPNRKTFCDEINFLENRFGAAIYAPF